MGIEIVFINAGITVLALGLFLLSYFGYKRHKNPRLLFATVAFFLFFMKGVLLSIGLFFEDIPSLYEGYLGVFDMAVLALLFIGTLKR